MAIINEEWRSITEYINYQVSNLGRVRNSSTGRILNPFEHRDGTLSLTLCGNGCHKKHKVHRLVAQEFLSNPQNKKLVDHIDHNRLNNRIDNLRWATSQENNMNRSKSLNTTSQYKGVYFHKAANKWQSRIKINRTTKYIGSSNDEKETARAYNRTAIEIFGEYARLNEISDEKI